MRPIENDIIGDHSRFTDAPMRVQQDVLSTLAWASVFPAAVQRFQAFVKRLLQ
jgi:hypothetical protein